MLNKRKLIRLLLRYNHSEASFFDLKRELGLKTRKGKAKLLKHISALSNANPGNESYIIVGISDKSNDLIGADFLDDANIQNLVHAYLKERPGIRYENVTFPELPKGKYIGLLTISPSRDVCRFSKSIAGYHKGDAYIRFGSTSVPLDEAVYSLDFNNVDGVKSLQSQARVRLSDTINSVLAFFRNTDDSYNPRHFVFQDQHVLCFSGWKVSETLWSECNVELVGENVEMFFSATKHIALEQQENALIITEYVALSVNYEFNFYPLEETIIRFSDTGDYEISNSFVFVPPVLNQATGKQRIQEYNAFVAQWRDNDIDWRDARFKAQSLASELLVCILNGVEEAGPCFEDYLYEMRSGTAAEAHDEAKWILKMCEENGIVPKRT